MTANKDDEIFMVSSGPHVQFAKIINDLFISQLDGARFEKIQTVYKQIVAVCPTLTTCQLAVACWCKCNEDRPVHFRNNSLDSPVMQQQIYVVQRVLTPKAQPKLELAPANGFKRKKNTLQFGTRLSMV